MPSGPEFSDLLVGVAKRCGVAVHLQHGRYPDVFALGDAGSSRNATTGAAIRKQAPVVVANHVDVMAGREPGARHDVYASCPLTTSRHAMLLAEFDHSMMPSRRFR